MSARQQSSSGANSPVTTPHSSLLPVAACIWHSHLHERFWQSASLARLHRWSSLDPPVLNSIPTASVPCRKPRRRRSRSSACRLTTRSPSAPCQVRPSTQPNYTPWFLTPATTPPSRQMNLYDHLVQKCDMVSEACRAAASQCPWQRGFQTARVVAGERFELFWNEEDQRWHYRDAVRLDAEQAARLDLPPFKRS